MAAGPMCEMHRELRVSSLELFFDLVFVLTITQLASLLSREVSLVGALQVLLIFVVLFWMYGGYVWLTNQVPPVSNSRRLLLIGGMVGFFVCALAIPRAFVNTGLVFGLGYLLLVLVHSGLYAQVHGRAVLRFTPFNVAGAVSVIVASRLGDVGVYALWVAPIALQYVASYLARTVDETAQRGFDIRPGHFVERHGGLLIVALGESIAAIGIGVTDLSLDLPTIAVAVLGLLLAAALWWIYFGSDEEQAKVSLASATVSDRVRMALFGYFYAFIPMLLGITTLAAGVKLSITNAEARLEFGAAALLAIGVAAYLVGDTVFRKAMHIQSDGYRLIAAGVALCTIPLGFLAAGFIQMIGLLAALVAVLAIEARRQAPVIVDLMD
jgi:low temperature requirement protein LtrA